MFICSVFHLVFTHIEFLFHIFHVVVDAKHQDCTFFIEFYEATEFVYPPTLCGALRKVRSLVVSRLLRATGNEVGPYPGLPGHSLQHLQDCQHGHVHLGARKSPLGQTGQSQRLDGRTQ